MTIAALLAIAAALRFWNVNFGLPAIYRPDENVTVARAVGVLRGSLDPMFADWPHLYFYLSAAFLAPFQVLGLVHDQPSAHLAVRSLDVVFGTATVLLVLEFGRRAYGWAAGYAAAAGVAVAFLLVRDSHFATLDAPLAFSCIGGLYVAYRTLGDGRLRPLMFNGVAAGLATSIKYSGAFVAIGMAVAQWLGDSGARQRLVLLLRRLAVIGAIGVVALLVTSPFLLLNPGMTAHGLGYIFSHLASDTVPEVGWVRLVVALWYGLDPLLFTLAIVGVVIAAWRREAPDLILLAFILGYYLVIGAGHSVFLRYADPLIPPLLLLAGRALLVLIGWLSPMRWRTVALVGALTLSLAPAIIHDIRYNVLIGRTDTRSLAFDWLASHVPGDGRVAIPYKSGPAHDQALIDSRWQSVGETDPYLAGFLENRLQNQYHVRELTESDLQTLTVDQLRSEGVQFVVIGRQHPDLGCGAPLTPLEQDLRRQAALAATFQPTSTDCPASVFDPIDTYYVPLAGYAGWVRPGPYLRIYRLHD